jgi:DNA-binding MarR family transcriptional regulator
MRTWDIETKPRDPITLEDVYEAPGHLIRRCQQIAVAIFLDEFSGYVVTPVQYAALVAIRDRPGIDQKSMVEMIAIDRSTIGTMLKGLEAKALIRRVTPPTNLRIKQLFLEPPAMKLLDETHDLIVRAQQRMLAPLEPDERDVLLRLLKRMALANNELSRAPLKLIQTVSSGERHKADATPV